MLLLLSYFASVRPEFAELYSETVTRGRNDIAARLGLDDRLLSEHVDGLVIDHVAVADKPVLTVGRVRIERDIADDADRIPVGLLEGAHSPADEVVRIERFFAARRFLLSGRRGKEGHGRDAQLPRFSDRFHEQVDRQPIDAWHRRDWRPRAATLFDEYRPNQIVDRQLLFPDKSPRPIVSPITPQPRVRISTPIAGSVRICHEESPLRTTAFLDIEACTSIINGTVRKIYGPSGAL